MSLYGSSNSTPGINIAQLLALLSAGGNQAGKPLPNAAPAFNSPTGGAYGGVTPPNFGGGAMMPQGAAGGGMNMSQMLPLLMMMNKNNNSNSGGGGGGGKGGSGGLLGSLFGGKGGAAPTAMDMMSYGGLGDAASANSIAAMAGGFG